MTMTATQYLALLPKRDIDSTMFHLPDGRFVIAQYDDVSGAWEVRADVGFDSPGTLIEIDLTRGEAETLAHGVRLVRLAEMDASS
jgi:hypothetical protein